MAVYNPLLDKRKKRIETTASENVVEADGPISPISNRRMVRASANGVPVFVDAQARLVLPIKVGV